VSLARLLVIEDNADNRELMTYLLTAFGHDVETAVDGRVALDALATLDVDLIICDVHLPKVDGRAVVDAVKRDPRLREVPVVAVTALAMVGDRSRLLASGFDGYIPKPIDPQRFVAEIEAHLPKAGRAGRVEG
jgi:two-component system, cell cycle response regulator